MPVCARYRAIVGVADVFPGPLLDIDQTTVEPVLVGSGGMTNGSV
jgi:hypothetical protein